MNFSEALNNIKEGKKVAREGWNGKSQFIFLAKDIEFNTDADLKNQEGEIFCYNSLAIKTTKNEIQIGWLASQSDMLSDDWELVE